MTRTCSQFNTVKELNFCVKFRNFSLFLVVKIFGNELFPQSFRAFPQKFHTEKLGKILIFYVVNKGVALLQLTTS